MDIERIERGEVHVSKSMNTEPITWWMGSKEIKVQKSRDLQN